jgi:hypothetical protein
MAVRWAIGFLGHRSREDVFFHGSATSIGKPTPSFAWCAIAAGGYIFVVGHDCGIWIKHVNGRLN